MKNLCRQLRNSQTEAERLLWSRLRDRRFSEVKFRRQHKVGNYIADFCSPEAKLVLEIDGGQHAENRLKDQSRTERLALCGYGVLHFWNHEVLGSLDAVLEKIRVNLVTPHPNPLPGGAREEAG